MPTQHSKNISRRKFIHSGLIAGEAASILLANPNALYAAKPIEKPNNGRIYKLGILGCGNRCKQHINVLNDVPEIQIAALCDVLPRKMDWRAKQIRKGPQPQKYTDMEKMLGQEDLDAIAVLLPNHMHKTATIAALDAGKHVFCEKPMAMTVKDCNEMIAASKRTGKAIQVGTQRRHSPGCIKGVEAIRKASLGAILSSDVNSYRGDWRFPTKDEYAPGEKYWRMDQALCGGVVYEMGAHIIDLNNWIFDSEPSTIVSLQGVNNRSLRSRDSADHGGVLVRFANSALMNYGGNLYNYGSSGANYFFAVNGSVCMEDMGNLEIRYGNPKGVPEKENLPKPISMDLRGSDGTAEQWNYFATVLAGQAEPFPNGITARQSIQICQGSVISAKEGVIVNVKDLDTV